MSDFGMAKIFGDSEVDGEYDKNLLEHRKYTPFSFGKKIVENMKIS